MWAQRAEDLAQRAIRMWVCLMHTRNETIFRMVSPPNMLESDMFKILLFVWLGRQEGEGIRYQCGRIGDTFVSDWSHPLAKHVGLEDLEGEGKREGLAGATGKGGAT